jgi:hypothetical protein
MTKGKKVALIILIVLNCMVLMGQVYPAGAPPFARIVNILFLLGSLIYFITQVKARN